MAKKGLSTTERKNRVKWKILLTDVSNRGRRRTASKITERVNEILKAWGKNKQLLYAHVNLFRSLPKQKGETDDRDLRVPQTPEVANALVWAIDDLGAWVNDSPEDKEKEQNDLTRLIGFNSLDRPKETALWTLSHLTRLPGFGDLYGGETLRGREGVLKLLDTVADEADYKTKKKLDNQLVVAIRSSIGFHTAFDPDIRERILTCIDNNVFFLFVIGQDWSNDFPQDMVRLKLEWALKQSIARAKQSDPKEIVTQSSASKLFTVLLPEPKVPDLCTRLMRTALVCRLLKPCDRFNLDDMRWAEVVGGWAEVTPELNGHIYSGLSEWIVVANPASVSIPASRIWGKMFESNLPIQPLFKELLNGKSD